MKNNTSNVGLIGLAFLLSVAPWAASTAGTYDSDCNCVRQNSSGNLVIVDRTSPRQANRTLARLPPKSEDQVVPFESVVGLTELNTEKKGNVGLVVSGWADRVPLGLALRQVAPGGWTVDENALSKEEKEKEVSWSGGRLLSNILETLSRRGHIHIYLDWSDKKIYATSPGDPPPNSDNVTLPATPVVTVKTWALKPGQTLKQNVKRWAKKAGWNAVVWSAANYPIYAPVTFTGDLASDSGPIAKLVEAYASSDQPIAATFSTKDKVLYVFNRGYSPIEAAPVSVSTLTDTDVDDFEERSQRKAMRSQREKITRGSNMQKITISRD